MVEGVKKLKKKSGAPSQLDELIKGLEQKVESVNAAPQYNPQRHNDETRSKIALFFVGGFFIAIGIVLIGIPIYNFFAFKAGMTILDLKDILLALSGLISGPLGFVIGHYFKSEQK